MKRIWLSSALVAAGIAAHSAPASADFSSCVASLRAEASRQGVPANVLNEAFSGLQSDMKVLDFQRDQPEFKTPIWDYLAGLVDDERVADGKARMAEYSAAFATAEQRYGVNRYVIAAVWGVELISAIPWASGRSFNP